MKNEQYFATKPTSIDEEFTFNEEMIGKNYQFYSNNGVFSKNKLDFGTLTLVNVIADLTVSPKTVLDLGTGYGPIALFAANQYPKAQIVATEVNERALKEARKNFEVNGVESRIKTIKSDLFSNINQSFDLIISNPPFRAGKKVINSLVEQSLKHLTIQGQLILVVQRKQGEPSLKKKMAEVFGNCEILKRNKGYYILKAQNIE